MELLQEVKGYSQEEEEEEEIITRTTKEDENSSKQQLQHCPFSSSPSNFSLSSSSPSTTHHHHNNHDVTNQWLGINHHHHHHSPESHNSSSGGLGLLHQHHHHQHHQHHQDETTTTTTSNFTNQTSLKQIDFMELSLGNNNNNSIKKDPSSSNANNINNQHQQQHQQEQQQQQQPSTHEKEHMFDKVVTPSDVGKLNRLVIPKQHAEKYFPLDSTSNEKGLLLNFEDRNGKLWRFRYSYWNSSQSYVMTKGWSRFVKEKKLDAGDIVSFQRGVGDLFRHRLFIDWRRRLNHNHNIDPSGTLFTPFFLPNQQQYSIRWGGGNSRFYSLPYPKMVLQDAGVTEVELAAISNGYAGYMTTREEYLTQNYEGASTLFGPNQLAAVQQELERVARSVVDPSVPLDVGPTPLQFNRSELAAVELNTTDTAPFQDGFSHVRTQPAPIYSIGSVASAEFAGAHPMNALTRVTSFCDVQKLDSSGVYTTVLTDAHWDLRYYWERYNESESKNKCEWMIRPDGRTSVAGTYRFIHRGFSKDSWGRLAAYEGASMPFTVTQ